MNRLGAAAIVVAAALSAVPAGGQTTTAAGPVRKLVYEFGFNTPVASQGNGTGKETIEILGPAKDGGMMVSGTDYWWNTARPRATNTCEVYATGSVTCAERPYALSPIQLTIFPLLGKNYFKGLNASGTSEWKRDFNVSAAVLPGASGFAGNLYTWKCDFTLQGKGPVPNAARYVLILQSGTLTQQGGRYWKANEKAKIVYDPVAHVPGIVSEERAHIPQRSVYNNDTIEVKLIKDSKG